MSAFFFSLPYLDICLIKMRLYSVILLVNILKFGFIILVKVKKIKGLIMKTPLITRDLMHIIYTLVQIKR